MPPIAFQILQCTDAAAIREIEHVQTLWSGYGSIKRYKLEGGKYPSVIVKHIQLPESGKHPRGWNTDLSHQRKIKSYAVESYWYEHYARLTGAAYKVPQLLHTEAKGSMRLLIMEDLNTLGFPKRLTPDTVSLAAAKNCLTWLVRFHARFMQVPPKGLWEMGTYWHLETRPDELAKMNHLPLQQAASAIDQRLNEAAFQTLVHGDAKLANFCFGPEDQVDAVDFSIVGKAVASKYVAILSADVFAEEAWKYLTDELFGHYFKVTLKWIMG